jgi:DNA invertase Pin-like site-specific DNA recombinase
MVSPGGGYVKRGVKEPRLLIGEHTKAALAAAKQRGVRLGIYGAETLAPRYRAEARARAEQLASVIRESREGRSIRGIAVELEKQSMPSPRGGKWHPQLVKRVVQRLDAQLGYLFSFYFR